MVLVTNPASHCASGWQSPLLRSSGSSLQNWCWVRDSNSRCLCASLQKRCSRHCANPANWYLPQLPQNIVTYRARICTSKSYPRNYNFKEQEQSLGTLNLYNHYTIQGCISKSKKLFLNQYVIGSLFSMRGGEFRMASWDTVLPKKFWASRNTQERSNSI